MSAICENVECPICMDVIEGNNNRVTTECGHYFHTKCLMTSVAHNGFGCPYCRTKMAEEQEHDDEESEYSDYEDEEIDDDYVLRGLRFFTNNLNCEPHDPADIEDEAQDQEQADDDEVEVEEVPKPTPFLITQKLMEQGVTMEQLVKVLLLDHDEYEREDEEYSRIGDEMFGKLRIIISNHRPAPEVQSIIAQAPGQVI